MMLRVHSIQSLGTLDGPGVRFIAFLQGCPLRCKCCHNPDTWEMAGGKEISVTDLVKQVLRYREYFGKDGGITISGGEPLLQAHALKDLFRCCKKHGINTCLDTSGCLLNEDVISLLDYTDKVLLDIKYTNDRDYISNVGCSIELPIKFLKILQEKGISTTIRQVIIPTINDNEENILRLKDISAYFPVVDKVELLAFHKMCQSKYDSLGKEFPFGHLQETDDQVIFRLTSLL